MSLSSRFGTVTSKYDALSSRTELQRAVRSKKISLCYSLSHSKMIIDGFSVSIKLKPLLLITRRALQPVSYTCHATVILLKNFLVTARRNIRFRIKGLCQCLVTTWTQGLLPGHVMKF